MSHAEYGAWVEFHRLYGIDDFARIHRPAALIAAAAGGGKFEELAEFLQPERGAEAASDVDASLLRAFGLTKPKNVGA